MPKYKVVITPRAIVDIQKAVSYYNTEKKGLGARFYADFKRQLSAVKQHPFSRAIRYDDIRFAMLHKFPYAAHYNIEGNLVVIYGVISTHQNPETAWIGR